MQHMATSESRGSCRPCAGRTTAIVPAGLRRQGRARLRYATVSTVASTAWARPPATTELCAPHNRRLLTDDRRLAAPRLPERTQRPAGVASETWTGSAPSLQIGERGGVRRGG